MKDWRGAVNRMASQSQSTDVVIILPEWNKPPAEYYIDRLQPPPAFAVIPVHMKQLQQAAGSANPKGGLSSLLASRGIGAFERVWILTDKLHGKNPTLQPLLGRYQVYESRSLSGVSLFLIE